MSSKRSSQADKEASAVVDFLFEAGILAETPRSGFHFLGSGKQSVAEHLNRVSYIGYALAMVDGTVDIARVLKMCLFHDFAEARVSDLNYVHQKYVKSDETGAIADATKQLPFGDDVAAVMEEYEARVTPEALIAKDSDTLEWILSLKEQADTGNSRAQTWLPSATARLNTAAAQSLAASILDTDSDHWWFANKDDEWWVTRNKNTAAKK